VFTIGQKVKLKGRPEVNGRILKVTPKWVEIEYDKTKKWIPAKDWHEVKDVVADIDCPVQIEYNYQVAVKAECECGAKFTQFPDNHAGYCPKANLKINLPKGVTIEN